MEQFFAVGGFAALIFKALPAYLDPSAINHMISIIAGLVIVAGATVTIFWKKIRLFFKRKKHQKKMDALDSSAPEKKDAE